MAGTGASLSERLGDRAAKWCGRVGALEQGMICCIGFLNETVTSHGVNQPSVSLLCPALWEFLGINGLWMSTKDRVVLLGNGGWGALRARFL